MKQAVMKRILLALFLLCGSLIFYLFWQQNNIELPQVIHNPFKTAYQAYVMKGAENPVIPRKFSRIPRRNNDSGINRKPDSQWTWKCNNQNRCERHLRSAQDEYVPLTTCNAFCGVPKLWPMPRGRTYIRKTSVSFVHQQISPLYFAKQPAKGLLEHSFATFNQNIANMVPPMINTPQKSDIKRFLVVMSVLHSHENKLKLSTDESYNLTLQISGDDLVATVKAVSFFGARHGLETLSQLIWWDDGPSEGSLKVFNAVDIDDAPAFAYRGLMIDTARNFMPLDGLKRTIVGMSMNKLNVFHWHMTDSQSFPFDSPSVPQMAHHGAYGPDMVYSSKDVKELVEFANKHGIRVLIEIDTPAHAGNGWDWGVSEGLGKLAVCVNEQPWSLYCGEPPCGQLNPLNPNTYNILQKLYKDIIELTGETELFHMGGDEVNLECWNEFLDGANYTDFHDLWGLFTIKALEKLALANGGTTPPNVIFWSSNLSRRPYSLRYLDKSKVIIQAWSPSEWIDTYDVLADGYKVIMSHVDAWYLDCGFGRWRETGEAACDPYRPWQTIYLHQPWLSSVNKNQVVGGEACLWSEQLDAGSLDARLWPRTAAFAERIWSDPRKDPRIYSIDGSVYMRLTVQRDRMISRGLGAEALWPQWCSQNPGSCL